MTTRRDFLKLGALFVPVVAAPTVAYSFLCARSDNEWDRHAELVGVEGRFWGETDDQLRSRIRATWERLTNPHLGTITSVSIGGHRFTTAIDPYNDRRLGDSR